MAIFECQVRGTDGIRLVKAATAVQARDHIVSAKAIGAERMADLIEGGTMLERPIPSVTADDQVNATNGVGIQNRDDGQPKAAHIMETPDGVDDGLIVDGKLDPSGALRQDVPVAGKGKSK